MNRSGKEQSKKPSQKLPESEQMSQAAATANQKERNTVGLIALIVAIVGFVFACIPGALIVGWILLPVAFVLSIVGLALSDKTKGTSIAAIILSIVGVIVGVTVFFTLVVNAVDEAVEKTPADVTSAENSAAADSDKSAAGDEVTAKQQSNEKGSRANPAELGATISGNKWDITVDGFDANATQDVLAVNPMNEKPDENNTYAVAEVTATYTGSGSGNPMSLQFAYVTAEGNTMNTYDTPIVGPSPMMGEVGDMYEGASQTFKVTLEIPAENAGLLRVTPGMMSEEAFVSTS